MRKSKAKKRYLLPDPKFNDTIVTRFINNLMYSGKKTIASTIFYDAIEIVTKRTNEVGIEVWRKALANVTPQVEVSSRRVGCATFQIPSEVRPERKTALAMSWMVGYSRKRNEKSMAMKLDGEIIAASKEEGAAFKKKEDVHKMAEANKAFSHFRF